jgi:hypothetical protein
MSESKQKFFLLEAGWSYEGHDMVALFDTREAAESVIKQIKVRRDIHYEIFGRNYDYYEITDLRELVNAESNHESGAFIVDSTLIPHNQKT